MNKKMENKQEKLSKPTVIWLTVILLAIIMAMCSVKYVKVTTKDIIIEPIIETDENVINLTEVNMTIPEYINLTYENEMLNKTNLIQ